VQVGSGQVTAAAIADELHDRRLGLVSYCAHVSQAWMGSPPKPAKETS
jgi:hypothetical protein